MNEANNIKTNFEGVRGIAVKILNRIDRTDAYLDKLLEQELKHNELSGSEKSLLYEIVHGAIRWENKIDWTLNGFYRGQFSKCAPTLKNVLRIAAYQILYLDKIPYYAAVNEAVEFIKKSHGQKTADLTNAVLRNIIRNKENIKYPDKNEDYPFYLSVFYSHPLWLVKRWLSQFGKEKTEALLMANNEKPPITLKINLLTANERDFEQALHSVDLKFQKGKYLRGYYRLKKITNITDWDLYKKGWFFIQDESAGLACSLLNAQKNDKVLDFCAAPGGKTSYIAGAMMNQGKIIALDRYESRLEILKKNLERLKIGNVETINIDGLEYEGEIFDKILIDAPCSGLGTLSKKPDLKWKKSPLDIRKATQLQIQFLNKAAALVKKGGILIYSVCTIEKEETLDIVEKFLAGHNDFELVPAAGFPEELLTANGCVQSYPDVHKIDGAFAAKLKRIN